MKYARGPSSKSRLKPKMINLHGKIIIYFFEFKHLRNSLFTKFNNVCLERLLVNKLTVPFGYSIYASCHASFVITSKPNNMWLKETKQDRTRLLL